MPFITEHDISREILRLLARQKTNLDNPRWTPEMHSILRNRIADLVYLCRIMNERFTDVYWTYDNVRK